MAIVAIKPVQVIEERILETLQRRIRQARQGEMTAVVVMWADRDGNLVLDHSLSSNDRDVLVGRIEVLKTRITLGFLRDTKGNYYDDCEPGEDEENDDND